MALTREEIIETWQRHLDPAFIKLLGLLGYGRVFVRAEGTRLYDDAGREYLDALAGFGSVNVGHNHPRLIARLQAHLTSAAPNFNHLGPTPHAAALARRLAEWLPAPLQVMLWSSTGAEAVEAGLKLARAVTGRAGYVHCEGGFHGTSLGTLGAMGTPRLRAPFEPLLPGGAAVPFGDLDALEAALRAEQRGAFLVEPLQAEGGVHLAPEGYLAAAQALCRTHGALLVLDEVQTGLGRIGARFAFENEGFVPDVLVLAKALSGGLLPIGATITSAALHQKAYGATDRFDLHSSTFGGNALSCVCAEETLAILDDEGLAARAAAAGERLLSGLRARLGGHRLVRDVRGRGLLVGIELGPTERGALNKLAPGLVRSVARGAFGQWASLRLLERGIIAQPASHRWDVLRLEPPLTVADAEIDTLIAGVGDVLDAYEGITPLLRDVTARLGRQAIARWRF